MDVARVGDDVTLKRREGADEMPHPLRRRGRPRTVKEIVDGRDSVRLRPRFEIGAVIAQRTLGARDRLAKPALINGARLTPGADIEIEVENLAEHA